MRLRSLFLGLVLLVATPSVALAQGDNSGGGTVDHSGVSVGWSRGDAYTSGGDSDCVYWTAFPGLPVGDGIGGSQFLLDGVVSVYVVWNCDPDAEGPLSPEGGDFVELADLDGLALAALDAVPWPEMDIKTVPEEDGHVVSGFPIGLRLDGPATFETEFVADASDNGVVVTATATAELLTWDTGPINSYWGGEDLVVCDTFGESFYDGNPCTVTWKSSSAVVPGDRITLVGVVLYSVEYTTNLAPGAFDVGPAEFELVFERPDFPVAEIQAVVVRAG